MKRVLTIGFNMEDETMEGDASGFVLHSQESFSSAGFLLVFLWRLCYLGMLN